MRAMMGRSVSEARRIRRIRGAANVCVGMAALCGVGVFLSCSQRSSWGDDAHREVATLLASSTIATLLVIVVMLLIASAVLRARADTLEAIFNSREDAR